MRHNAVVLLIGAAFALGCSDAPPTAAPPTVPPEPVPAAEIDRLLLFVRDWPNDYVEVHFTRQGDQSTTVMFRPPQPGVPRVLLDSIGPGDEDPAEIVEILTSYNVWAMADSNATGAACSTRSGQWVCNITVQDYSLVLGVERDGDRRAQRYTGLGGSGANQAARALGDYVLAWLQRVEEGPAGPTLGR